MSFIKTIGAEVRDWEMSSNPPIGSFGYRDLIDCDYRIFYKVCECERFDTSCKKCIFNWQSDELCAHAPNCRACDRKDMIDVYFKAVEIKSLDELL